MPRPRKTLAQQHREADLLTVLSTAEGRRVWARLLTDCGLHRAAYVPGDALATAFREGQRSIALAGHSAATSLGQTAITSLLMAEVLALERPDDAGPRSDPEPE